MLVTGPSLLWWEQEPCVLSVLGMAMEPEVDGAAPCMQARTQTLSEIHSCIGEKPVLGGIYSSPDKYSSIV